MNTDDLEATASFLASRLDRLLQTQRESTAKRRIIIALAGVPGSGKSTISAAILSALSERGVRDAAILPMVSFDQISPSNWPKSFSAKSKRVPADEHGLSGRVSPHKSDLVGL